MAIRMVVLFIIVLIVIGTFFSRWVVIVGFVPVVGKGILINGLLALVRLCFLFLIGIL